MDRCTGRRDITEILMKTTLNTIQSTQSIVYIGIGFATWRKKFTGVKKAFSHLTYVIFTIQVYNNSFDNASFMLSNDIKAKITPS